MSLLYNIQFENLCEDLDLGKLLNNPSALSGGLMHKMFALETTKGKYAVKALNPEIMTRPTALQNYNTSEAIAKCVADKIHLSLAKTIQGAFLHKINNQYYMIFDWIDGRCLKQDEILIEHCKRIGCILAQIHKVDFTSVFEDNEHPNPLRKIDWDFYLCKGKLIQSEWINLLESHINALYLWHQKAIDASVFLSNESVMSHRDLDPKNVMWIKEKPLIIDWESAGPINQNHDLIETAIYWSLDQTGDLIKERFYAFIEAYQQENLITHVKWAKVLDLGYLSKLEWLEYSLKRSLKIECSDEHEQKMGTKHVTQTIESLIKYESKKETLEKWLCEF